MSETARSTVAAGCAIVLSGLLGACASSTSSTTTPANTATTFHGTAPVPSTTGTTSTANAATTTTSAATPSTPRSSQSPASPPTPASSPSGAPTPVAADFLPQSSLPDWPAYGWTKPQFNEVNVEHPLPDTCDNSSGPQVTRGVSEADYASRDSDIYAVENIYTYVSAADAAAAMTAEFPKCGGVTAHPANGFAWRGAGPGTLGLMHVLYTRKDNKIATIFIIVGNHDYNQSLDAQVLGAMAGRLSGS